MNLRAERPETDGVAKAVSDVLTNDNARWLADTIFRTNPLCTLDEILEDVSGRVDR
jgi:hypothetical protein